MEEEVCKDRLVLHYILGRLRLDCYPILFLSWESRHVEQKSHEYGTFDNDKKHSNLRNEQWQNYEEQT